MTLFIVLLLSLLAAFGKAGDLGEYTYILFTRSFGIGYFLIPIIAALAGVSIWRGTSSEEFQLQKTLGLMGVFIFSLGLIHILSINSGGILGRWIAVPLTKILDVWPSTIILVILVAMSVWYSKYGKKIWTNNARKKRPSLASSNQNSVFNKSVGIAILICIIAIAVAGYFVYRSDQSAKDRNDSQQAELDSLKLQIAKIQKDNIKVPISNDTGYSNLVKEWSKRVGLVTCSWFYQGQYDTPYAQDVGSMTIVNLASMSGVTAITNKHVVNDMNGYIPNLCVFYIPGVGTAISRYKSASVQDVNPFHIATDGTDLAYVTVGANADNVTDAETKSLMVGGLSAMQDVVDSNLKVCSDSKVQIGDKILILGYPVNGSQSSITATQGIVSGYDGQYYVTDAKIDHGNSGGAAVLIKDDCYLGIPSAASVGTIESYGRILSAKYVVGN
ncbi:MAG: trypsin-like peptidase domain-containing protein [Candidatus Taylorbacteria bacterium]